MAQFQTLLMIGFLFHSGALVVHGQPIFLHGPSFQKTNTTCSVSADAIVRVAPDQVVLILGAATRATDLKEAKAENSRVIEAAIRHCRKQGIPEKYIQTDFIKIQPSYHSHSSGISHRIEYFSVSQTIQIVLENVSQYDDLLTDLIDLGINQVQDIQFRTTQLREHRDTARRMAIQAAKEKAKLLSEETGLSFDRIMNVHESHSRQSPSRSFSASNYANVSQNVGQVVDEYDEADGLSVGLISIKASVTLVYHLEPE